MISLLFEQSLRGQLSFKINVAPTVVNGQLILEGLELQIKNQIEAQSVCVLQLHSDRFQSNLIAESKELIIQENEQRFSLSEIFSTSSLSWENIQTKNICFQLVSVKQQLPFGISCFEVLSSKNKKQSREEESFLQKQLDANVNYQLLSHPSNDFYNDNHLINYSGSAEPFGVPIKFQGSYQNNADPYLDNTGNRINLFVDFEGLNENTIKKLLPKMQEALDSLKADYPMLSEWEAQKAYLDKILEDPSVERTLKEITEIETIEKQLGIGTEFTVVELEKYLLSQIELQKNHLQENLDDISKDEQKQISEKIEKIEIQLEQLKKLKKLYEKRVGLEKIQNIRNEALNNLSIVGDEKERIHSKIENLKNNPKQLLSQLEKEGLSFPGADFLAHMNKFRVGNINPQYTSLALQNSQIRGLEMGASIGKFGLSGFHGKALNNTSIGYGDTTQTSLKISGLEFAFIQNEQIKHTVFGIFASGEEGISVLNPTSIIGYSLSKGKGSNGSQIQFAFSDLASQDEIYNSKISNSALSMKHSFSTLESKLSGNIQARIIGPNFNDLNNPYLLKNSIESTGNLSFRLNKNMNLGFNGIVQSSGIFDSETYNNNQFHSSGIVTSIYHDKWPTINLAVNYMKTTYGEFEFRALQQNLTLFKRFEFSKIGLNSMLHSQYSKTLSNENTKQSNFVNINFSQEIVWNQAQRSIIILNYGQSNESYNQLSNNDLIFGIQHAFLCKNLSLTPGFQYIKNSTIDNVAYTLDLLYQVSNSISLQCNMNSNFPSSFVQEGGNFQTEYGPRFNLHLNYRL